MTEVAFSRSWRNTAMVMFATGGVAISTWGPRLPSIRESLDLGDGAIGVLLASVTIGSIAGLASSSALLHALNPRRAILLALVVVAFGIALVGYGAGTLHSTALASIGFICVGVGIGALDGMINLQGAAVEHASGKTLMPLLHAALSVGAILGSALGAGAALANISFEWQFVGEAAIVILAGVGSVRFIPLLAEANTSGDTPALRTRARLWLRGWLDTRLLAIGRARQRRSLRWLFRESRWSAGRRIPLAGRRIAWLAVASRRLPRALTGRGQVAVCDHPSNPDCTAGKPTVLGFIENLTMDRSKDMRVLEKFSLAGRKALVTGGNRGLGKSFVRALAEAGADVTFIARDSGVSEAALAELDAVGVHATAITADLTDSAELHRSVTLAADRLGGLDILVNNAGSCFHRDAADVPDAEWQAVFDLNVTAVFRTSVAALPHMSDGGSIVNIGSMSGFIVNRPQNQPAYNASKAAVHHLTKSLAQEWAPLGVRVNAIAPGYVRTEMSPVDNPEFRRFWIEDAPMRRVAEPDEIAPAVVFLASDASSFMTGSVVVLDGGYTIW
jgi:NAD(P)-dependent dehydrogenase (short-subunit alcohol dehydrogenase family)/MFS family permease